VSPRPTPEPAAPAWAGWTFRGWLQQHRDDEAFLGELAAYAWGGAGCHPACRFSSAAEFARHIAGHDPPASTLAATRVALKLYRAYRRTRGG
jgi:hypothetical protein